MYTSFKQMEELGGSFLKAICRAFRLADGNNHRRLASAYPEIERAYKYYMEIGEDAEMDLPVIDVFSEIERAPVQEVLEPGEE